MEKEDVAYYLITDGTTGDMTTALIVDAVTDNLQDAIRLFMADTGIPRNQVVVNPVLGPIDTEQEQLLP